MGDYIERREVWHVGCVRGGGGGGVSWVGERGGRGGILRGEYIVIEGGHSGSGW